MNGTGPGGARAGRGGLEHTPRAGGGGGLNGGRRRRRGRRRRGEWAAPGGVGGDGVVDGEAAQQPGGVVRCVKRRAQLKLGAGIYIRWAFSTGL